MNKILVIILALVIITAYPCSEISISVLNKSNVSGVVNVIGARSYDFEQENNNNMFAFGDKGVNNVSNVNMHESNKQRIPDKLVVKWINKYKFLGITGNSIGNLKDGINSAGLQVGSLYLPNITVYPEFDYSLQGSNSGKIRMALSWVDTVNYLLGEANSVKNAIYLLTNEVQIVNSAASNNGVYGVYPVHFMLQDKTGDRAIIEFVYGKMQIYHDSKYAVLTNSPSYPYHLNQLNTTWSGQFVNHNTRQFMADGLNMNGSGYYPLHGDTTPPSRFVRAMTLLSAMQPQVFSDNEAYYVANQIINSVTVPAGLNVSATDWVVFFNLNTGDYWLHEYIKVNFATDKAIKIMVENNTPMSNYAWSHYNIISMTKQSATQAKMIIAQVTREIVRM